MKPLNPEYVPCHMVEHVALNSTIGHLPGLCRGMAGGGEYFGNAIRPAIFSYTSLMARDLCASASDSVLYAAANAIRDENNI